MDRRGVHAQCFGDLADSKKSRELFHLLPPDPLKEYATSDDLISDSFEHAETTPYVNTFLANFPTV